MNSDSNNQILIHSGKAENAFLSSDIKYVYLTLPDTTVNYGVTLYIAKRHIESGFTETLIDSGYHKIFGITKERDRLLYMDRKYIYSMDLNSLEKRRITNINEPWVNFLFASPEADKIYYFDFRTPDLPVN